MNQFVEIADERFHRLCERMEFIESCASAINMWTCITMLGIKPFKDGNQWCFLYGPNLQEGIAGFGDSIFDAAWDFYSQIL